MQEGAAPLGRRRRRRHLFVALTLGIGFLLGALASELALRCYLTWSFSDSLDDIPKETPNDFGRHVLFSDLLRLDEDPNLIFTLKPNARATWLGAKIETNSRGLRSPEVAEEKTSGTLRVIGLGDSTMFGWGVEREQRYLDIVERETRRALGPARKVEFIDIAVPAYMAIQEVALFEREGLRLKPDAVIIQFDMNDIYIPYFMIKPNFFRLDHFYLAQIRHVLNGDYRKPDAILELGQERFIPERLRALNGWDPLKAAYRRLRDLCAERNIMLWAVIPAHTLLRDKPNLVADPAYGYFRTFCENEKIRRIETYWDLRDYAAAHGLGEKDLSLDPPRDIHPKPIRHAAMAYTISKEIIPWLAYGALTAEEARAKVGDIESFIARNVGQVGVYWEEDWNGTKVRWTEGKASFTVHPQGRVAKVKVWVGHPDVSEANPVRVTASVDGAAPASGEFKQQGLYALKLDLGEKPPSEARIKLETSRTFRPAGDSREMGVALFPMEFE